jgi:hypothetical protein
MRKVAEVVEVLVGGAVLVGRLQSACRVVNRGRWLGNEVVCKRLQIPT